MAQINARPRPAAATATTTESPRWMRQWWFFVLALLMFSELILPFLLWQAGFKQRADFSKEIFAGLLIAPTLIIMLLRDRVPGAMLFIIAATFVWMLVSLLDGQPVSATLWGWWRLFKYPMLLVFAYLIPRWPKDFARWLFRLIVILLTFELGVQFLQVAMGMQFGDSLAGTFGYKGVGPYTMFVFFVISIAFGHWLATGEAKTMVYLIAIGLVGTLLSITKFYLLAAALLGVAALVLHMIRGGKFQQLFIYVALFATAATIFVPIYNSYMNARGLRPIQSYLTRDAFEGYLFKDDKATDDGIYKLGRGAAVTYAWQQIQRDATTTLFGFGLGSRTHSMKLDLTGTTLEDDLYGGGGNTSLGIWIQEYGLVGLGLYFLLNFWIMFKLFRLARTTNDPYVATLAYGLILFTFFWPMWLWYHKAWLHGAMQIFYWVTLGFLFTQIYPRRRRRKAAPAPPRPSRATISDERRA